MTAINVVRMRVKPGFESDYLEYHRKEEFASMPGMKSMRVVKTGDRDFCLIGEWSGMDALAAARPAMIKLLDGFRDKLDDLGNGLGVTDPVSGELVIDRTA